MVTYGTGELHIRNARIEDGLSRYSCLTLHVLTQERKRSAPAILTVTGEAGLPIKCFNAFQNKKATSRKADRRWQTVAIGSNQCMAKILKLSCVNTRLTSDQSKLINPYVNGHNLA